ncbi:MAG: dimethylargininase [Acidobacteria bacterium]|nr:dimethylargininase [Acidobacteriota bacterium]MCI0591589.1 dimethylargininase [Gammaproteobacteria bacterium]
MSLIAITREVSPNLGCCELTHLSRETIDVNLAQSQHQQYEDCLAGLGCQIHRLPSEPELPDSVFVEDTAIVLDELAVIARPGTDLRKLETESVAQALMSYRRLSYIEPPGTIDGGDVLRIGDTVYIGLSGRSNYAGVLQMRSLLAPYGYVVKGVKVGGCLHLKSAVTEVGENILLINPAWVDVSVFGSIALIEIEPSEPFGGNALRVGDTVVYPSAYPRTRQRLDGYGIVVKTVDVSELGKAEGGVTCCSLIFSIRTA